MRPSFYVAEADGYVSTDWTRGPWDPRFQHAGPPAALLARAIEHLEGGEDFTIARFTVELLRSVPVGWLMVDATVARPGRRVQLAEATLHDDEGVIAVGRAWRIRREPTAAEASRVEPPPFTGPGDSPEREPFDPWNGPSYFSAVEWRMAAGSFMEAGPATTWMRMRGALVEGEEPSPIARALVAADSGNGISMELPLETHLFINTELTVHLFAEPVGDWVALEARTRIGPDGVGLASSVLYDSTRRIGLGNQSLLVRPR